jgi:hypothetical protein
VALRVLSVSLMEQKKKKFTLNGDCASYLNLCTFRRYGREVGGVGGGGGQAPLIFILYNNRLI